MRGRQEPRGLPDDDVRSVTGEVIDGPGMPTGAGPASRSPWDDGIPPVGRDPLSGGIRFRTYRLAGPPGGFGLWFGIGLLALGAYLVLAATFPAVAAAGSAVVVVAGFALIVAGGSGRLGSWAVYLGAPVAAIGIVQLGHAAGLLPGGGWTTLALGVTCLALAAWRAARHRGWRALAVFGGVLAIVGGVQAAGAVVPGLPSAGELVVPGFLVVVGVIVLARAFRRP